MLGEEDVDEVFARLSRRLERTGGSLADLEEVEAEAFEFFLQRNGLRLRFLQAIAMLDGELPVRVYEGQREPQSSLLAVHPELAVPS
jgi:hypothetical protein